MMVFGVLRARYQVVSGPAIGAGIPTMARCSRTKSLGSRVRNPAATAASISSDLRSTSHGGRLWRDEQTAPRAHPDRASPWSRGAQAAWLDVAELDVSPKLLGEQALNELTETRLDGVDRPLILVTPAAFFPLERGDGAALVNGVIDAGDQLRQVAWWARGGRTVTVPRLVPSAIASKRGPAVPTPSAVTTSGSGGGSPGSPSGPSVLTALTLGSDRSRLTLRDPCAAFHHMAMYTHCD